MLWLVYLMRRSIQYKKNLHTRYNSVACILLCTLNITVFTTCYLVPCTQNCEHYVLHFRSTWLHSLYITLYIIDEYVLPCELYIAICSTKLHLFLGLGNWDFDIRRSWYKHWVLCVCDVRKTVIVLWICSS